MTMFRTPEKHLIEYTNSSGEKLTLTLNWDADLSQFVKAFYLILRHASFTHKTTMEAFHKKNFKDDLS